MSKRCSICESENITQYKLKHTYCKECGSQYDQRCDWYSGIEGYIIGFVISLIVYAIILTYIALF